MKTYTTGEIAKLCDVHLRTVIRWIERGSLKGFKLPGRGNNRVLASDLVAFLKEYSMPIPDELQQHYSRSVLIVDDEQPIAKAISRALRTAGFETCIASDGFQAGSLLWSFKPVLMTLDLRMPGIDGYRVIEWVRESPDVSDVRILVISALGDAALQKALDVGADAVLSKPFDNAQLLDSVESLIETQPAA